MSKKVTTADFIERAQATHGDTYDYSKAVYINALTPLVIVCREHGDFEQLPNVHFRGSLCPACAMRNRHAGSRTGLRAFIERAKTKHGDTYDYSKAEYTNTDTRLTIICREHGEFTQTPYCHLKGRGCPACGALKSSNARRGGELRKAGTTLTAAFIEKARTLHGDRYDYTKTHLEKMKSKVTIICREHGEFMQPSENHLAGAGCKKCSEEANAKNLMLTQALFIERATAAHNGRYDYSESEYIGAVRPIRIMCPAHGAFVQLAENHLRGHGCDACARDRLAEHFRSNTKQFMEQARAVHGDRYDYSESEYGGNNKVKIKIGCAAHGPFMQDASGHLSGKGCPSCATGGFDPLRPGYLYLLISEDGGALKIGISNTPETRFRDFNRPSQLKRRRFTFNVIGQFCFEDGQRAYDAEQNAHRLFADLNMGLTGFDGASEWFRYSPDIMDWYARTAL